MTKNDLKNFADCYSALVLLHTEIGIADQTRKFISSEQSFIEKRIISNSRKILEKYKVPNEVQDFESLWYFIRNR